MRRAALAVVAVALLGGADGGVDPRLLLVLGGLLIAAKLGGEAVTRLGLPAVLGELAAGILAGNLGLFGWHGLEFAITDAQLAFLGELGVILLLFQVGLESNLGQMAKVGAAAFMQLAVITTVVVGNGYLAHHHGTDPAPWLPMMLAMVAGGAVTARLVPTVTIGHIATSWLFIAAVTLGLAFVLASQRFFVLIGVLVAAFLVPFPIALSALGAALARRRRPPPVDLPSATARG